MLPPEALTGLLAFLATAVVPAVLVRLARGDSTDPRFVFPLLYAGLTAGPAIWVALGGEFYAGVEVDELSHVFLVCSGAVVAFVVGASVTMRGVPAARPVLVTPDLVSARWIAIGGMALLLLAYGYASVQLKGSSPDALKAQVLLRGSPEVVRAYYLFSAACFVAGTLVVVLDSAVTRGRMTIELALLFLVYAAIQTWNDEREIALVVVGWLLMNARSRGRRVVLAVVVGTAFFVSAVAYLRAGTNIDDRLSMARQSSTDDLVETLLTKSSSNLFVMTKISRWVPEREPLRLGSTYVESLRSFLPGAPSKGLSDWFKERYAPGAASGYGFAMDAEAYLNFGWLGPSVVFFAWGAGLGALYRRTRRRQATWFAHYLWILMLTYSAFAIRADSRALLKIFIYGLVAGAAIAIAAVVMGRRGGAAIKHGPRPARLRERHDG